MQLFGHIMRGEDLEKFIFLETDQTVDHRGDNSVASARQKTVHNRWRKMVKSLLVSHERNDWRETIRSVESTDRFVIEEGCLEK